MLEEGQKAAALIMIARVGRKRTGDRCVPAVLIRKQRVATDLPQLARWTTFEGDDGLAVRDHVYRLRVFVQYAFFAYNRKIFFIK
jgi:hypothetical protein